MFVLVTPDEEIDLGSAPKLFSAWAELARAMGDQDKAYGNLLYVPLTDEEEVPAEIVQKMRAQAKLARATYADELSEHTRWLLEQIAGQEAHAWDEKAHPRHPEGQSDGGEFAPKSGGDADQGEWERTLSVAEKNALEFWGDGSYEMQQVMIGKGREGEEAAQHVPAFQSAIDRAPDYSDFVYRGIGGLSKERPLRDIPLEVGAVFTTKAPLSTSKRRKVTLEFSEGVTGPDELAITMKINMKRGADVSRVVGDEWADQKEVLIRKGSRLRVTRVGGVTQRDGFFHQDIELEEV